MCGIAGFCNMPENWYENITKMNDQLIHRGPDAEGIWAASDASVVLGHRRLSIVDLSEAGGQPMLSADGSYVMVLNGEIYNYKELASKLISEKKVTSFRGHSDTEVLLEQISAYGFRKAIESAKGMFAVAAYDRNEKKLYIARDRIGEKPLYYGFIKGGFLFASDLGAICGHERFTSELDLDALNLYFQYGYIPAPYTIYKDIKKLEAGSILEISYPFTQTYQYKYWDIMEVAKYGQTHLFKGTEKEAADELDRLLKDSVRGQMVADVPVGAFLSGGIDSTTVVGVMQHLSPRKIKTFSIGFENRDYNEAQYAKRTAAYLETDHTELYVTEKDVIDVIPQIPCIYSEPFADSSQIPTFLVSKLARQQVTVSLSGDGGDELFCGYNSYLRVRNLWNRIKNIPMPLRRLVSLGSCINMLMRLERMQNICHYIAASSPEKIYEWEGNVIPLTDKLEIGSRIPEFKYNCYPKGYLGDCVENNMMLMDFLMYHPDDILVKVDRASMAVSLESRIPLLDKDIVEYAWTLPLSYKADAYERKKILKNVLYRYIPKEMMERPKRGFSIPVKKWLQEGALRNIVAELLLSGDIRKQGILNEKAVRYIWENFERTGRGAEKIWYLLVFQMWLQRNNRLYMI